MTPEVTVIIPCGTVHAALLPDALGSCAQSTVPFKDVIVIDDASDPPVDNPTVRFNRHVGRSFARNVALKMAKTDWVYFLDADDMVLPETHRDFLHYYMAQNGNIDMFYGNYIVRQKGKQDKPLMQKMFTRKRLLSFMCMNIGMFVRRERALLVEFDESLDFGEDRDFAIRYTLNPKINVVKSHRPTFIFRRGQHSTPNAGEDYGHATNRINKACREGRYKHWETV